MSSHLVRKGGIISVVAPAYNEEGNIAEFVRRVRLVFDGLPGYDFEAIIVENGSADSTWERLTEERAKDDRVKLVRLSRNFGAEGGITAGLTYATGDAAVIISADLQDPPELIVDFVERWECGFDNVYGIVTRRRGSTWLRRVNSQAFYWLINKMTRGAFPRNVSDFRLVDRRAYQAINTMNERNRFLRGMFFWAGFRSVGIEHERSVRHSGESKATTRLVVSLALKSILSYSYVPLRIITYAGLSVSLVSFLFLFYTVYRIFAHGVPFDGYGTLIGVMLLMFGFLFTMLGVVAEYIGLVYEEVKARPNYIVSDEEGL